MTHIPLSSQPPLHLLLTSSDLLKRGEDDVNGCGNALRHEPSQLLHVALLAIRAPSYQPEDLARGSGQLLVDERAQLGHAPGHFARLCLQLIIFTRRRKAQTGNKEWDVNKAAQPLPGSRTVAG